MQGSGTSNAKEVNSRVNPTKNRRPPLEAGAMSFHQILCYIAFSASQLSRKKDSLNGNDSDYKTGQFQS